MSNDLIKVTEVPTERIDTWTIKMDGVFRESVEKHLLKDEFSKDAVDSIFSNAARILVHCPNPEIDAPYAKTGVVIGKVQSGKTSNFISVLALAFDNGYNVAVILGGNTLDLLKQNDGRIKSTFNVDVEKLTVLTTNDNSALINPDRIKEFIENGRKVIIVGLKHHKHINKISEIFENEFLRNQPILIIDDEGDQATLNTKAYLQSMSSTYESVVKLRERLSRHCFISITATPQANILIKAFDLLSPDFGELIYPGEGYCGLQEFHGENADKYIKEIPPDEGDLLDETGIPNSVYEAIALFFVGNAIRQSRGDMGNHAMLIHPSQKKTNHKLVVTKLQGLLDGWKTEARAKWAGNNDISYRVLQKRLLDAYHSFRKDGVVCPPFESLERTILHRIIECSPVHICNSDENASSNSAMYKTNIFVGGNLVERGITIKGLAITYITRRAKGKSNVDNTEQRARWFGYKAKYLDVCRVFTTTQIKNDFSSILEHDDDMWASIERAHERGIPFKEMPRIFMLSNAFLQLTRRNVAKTQQFEDIISEWKAQKYLILDANVAEYNRDIIENYKATHIGDIELKTYNVKQVHSILRSQDYTQVFNDLLSKMKYKATEPVNMELFSLLNEALKLLNQGTPLVDIIWVRDTPEHSTRKIYDDDSIQQLFQGRNPNAESSSYYEGDRSLVNEAPDHIQLQIHYVKPTNRADIDFYSPVLALYVPDCYSRQFEGLVVRQNG